ncbi:cell wall-binding repeat-containing protein [Salana multivorans]
MKPSPRRAAAALSLGAVMVIAPAASAHVTAVDEVARDPASGIGASGNRPLIFRLAGPDRVQTAWMAAKHTTRTPSATPLARVALLAGSEGYADALAAAPLARALGAPVLLAGTEGVLSSSVASSLADYDTVVVVSGSAQISEATLQGLRDQSVEVIRYAGETRFDTAAVVSLAALYWGSLASASDLPAERMESWSAFVADGADFPDALGAGPAAASHGGVVLLTAGESLPSVTRAALEGRFSAVAGVDREDYTPLLDWWQGLEGAKTVSVTGIGGKAVAAADGAGVALQQRVIGADRYETAAASAALVRLGNKSGRFFTLASGEEWADAVVASAFAADAHGPLLLVDRDRVPTPTREVLMRDARNADSIVLFGGRDVVSGAVTAEIADFTKR